MTTQDRLAYAPSPYSYTPNTTRNASINLDQEVQLAENAAERELHDSLAELYSIITTLEGLEKAYIKDSVTESEYTELCTRLLKQYKSSLSNEQVALAFGDLDAFQRQWNMDCPRASERLRVNLPATIADAQYAGASTPRRSDPVTPAYPITASGSQVLAATENFITFLDALKLHMFAKSDLHPLLADLIQTINQVTPAEFDGRSVIVKWLIRLNAMKAKEELSDEEARELGFEMEHAYRGFKGILS